MLTAQSFIAWAFFRRIVHIIQHVVIYGQSALVSLFQCCICTQQFIVACFWLFLFFDVFIFSLQRRSHIFSTLAFVPYFFESRSSLNFNLWTHCPTRYNGVQFPTAWRRLGDGTVSNCIVLASFRVVLLRHDAPRCTLQPPHYGAFAGSLSLPAPIATRLLLWCQVLWSTTPLRTSLINASRNCCYLPRRL